MLNSRDLVIGTLLGAIVVSLSGSESKAGFFDFFSPRRPAATTRRAQSPDPAFSAPGTPVPVYHQTGNAYGVTSYDSCGPTGWGYDSSPCFNCGELDHDQKCLRNFRKKWGQTWYPRVSPYCQSGWGWTQPCWRRMSDNYNCPRPEAPAPISSPTITSPAPVAEPMPPEPPPEPSTTAVSRSRSSLANRAAGFQRRVSPVAEPVVKVDQKVAPAQPQATRFTSFAETIELETDADDEADQADATESSEPAEAAEAADDTLESRMEAAELDPPADDDVDDSTPPAIEE